MMKRPISTHARSESGKIEKPAGQPGCILLIGKKKKVQKYTLADKKKEAKKKTAKMFLKDAPSPFPASPPVASPPDGKGGRDCPTPDLVTAGADFDLADFQPIAVEKKKRKPRLPSKKWEQREDEILMECQAKFPGQWNEIVTLLPGRTKGSAQHRWRLKTFKERMERAEIAPSADVVALVAAHATKIGAGGNTSPSQPPQANVPRKRPNPNQAAAASPSGNVGGVPLQRVPAQPALLAPQKAVGAIANGGAAAGAGAGSSSASRGPPPILPSQLPVEPPAKKQKAGSPPVYNPTSAMHRPNHQMVAGAATMPKAQPWAQTLPRPRLHPYPYTGTASIAAAVTNLPKSPLHENYETLVAKDFFGTIPVWDPDTVIMQKPLPPPDLMNVKSKINLPREKPKAKHVQWNFDDPDSSVGDKFFDLQLQDAFWVAPWN